MTKTLPHSIEAEQSVLGAIILDNTKIRDVLDHLSVYDFYSAAHQRIYDAVEAVFSQGQVVDLVTLRNYLSSEGSLEEIGGISYLVTLLETIPSVINVESYMNIVYEKALLRRLIDTAGHIAENAYAERNVTEVLEDSEKRILELSKTKRTDEFLTMKNLVSQVYEYTEQLASREEGMNGVPSGYSELDSITNGFQPNDLVIVAARPSVGKTAFALNVAQNAAVRYKKKVAVFSLEMGASQLVTRMLSAEGSINQTNLRTGKLTDDEWQKLIVAIGRLGKSEIYIDDTPGVRIGDIKSKCRRLKQEHGLDMIVIDYLQLIQSSTLTTENRQQEVSEISRQLKSLARELEAPVIALSQLSRGVEQRADKRPMMSDIRESGSIEQDADVIIMLYRDDYYERDEEEAAPAPIVETELIITKHRNGAIGTVKIAFQKDISKFVSIEKYRNM